MENHQKKDETSNKSQVSRGRIEVWDRDPLVRALQHLRAAESTQEAESRLQLSQWSADEEASDVSSEPHGARKSHRNRPILMKFHHFSGIFRCHLQALKTLARCSRDFVPVGVLRVFRVALRGAGGLAVPGCRPGGATHGLGGVCGGGERGRAARPPVRAGWDV